MTWEDAVALMLSSTHPMAAAENRFNGFTNNKGHRPTVRGDACSKKTFLDFNSERERERERESRELFS